MALKLPISTSFGIDLPEAYAKISNFSGTKDYFIINVDFFATQAARDAGTPVIKTASYQWNTASANALLATLYTQLKTEGDFVAAVDI